MSASLFKNSLTAASKFAVCGPVTIALPVSAGRFPDCGKGTEYPDLFRRMRAGCNNQRSITVHVKSITEFPGQRVFGFVDRKVEFHVARNKYVNGFHPKIAYTPAIRLALH